MGYTHGIPWNDDLIKENIMIVVEKLNLDHFPTHSEMIEVFETKALLARLQSIKGLYIGLKNLDCLLNILIQLLETNMK